MQNGSIQAKNGENVTREAWLVTASNLCVTELFKPALPDIDAPLFRVSLTAPKGTATSTVLGECWNPAASTAGVTEIFITAEKGADDSIDILTTLVHELCHAFDRNMSGHKAGFQRIASAVGLTSTTSRTGGQTWTHTAATPELAEYLAELCSEDLIGQIPHDALNPNRSGKTKQKNRQLKVECTACGFSVRMSQKNIDMMKTAPECLSCNTGTMRQAL